MKPGQTAIIAGTVLVAIFTVGITINAVSTSSNDTLILPKITGAYNKNVTQHTISSTICVSGYTARIRPPVAYTQALKRIQIETLKYADHNIKHYEEDHFIPLELGGNPTAVANLWPEPWAQASRSDLLENQLHRETCNHQITLTKARHLIKSFKLKNG